MNPSLQIQKYYRRAQEIHSKGDYGRALFYAEWAFAMTPLLDNSPENGIGNQIHKLIEAIYTTIKERVIPIAKERGIIITPGNLQAVIEEHSPDYRRFMDMHNHLDELVGQESEN